MDAAVTYGGNILTFVLKGDKRLRRTPIEIPAVSIPKTNETRYRCVRLQILTIEIGSVQGKM